MFSDIIRVHASTLTPIPTGTPPRLGQLANIRAVLFDVYGTMFVSASGDIGLTSREGRADAFLEATKSLGIGGIDPVRGVDMMHDVIGKHHSRLKSRGIEYPEVDIVEVWRDVMANLQAGMEDRKNCSDEELRRLAVEFECRVNPVWPMPNVADCLKQLAQRDLVLGIISNAQFFTLQLAPALLEGSFSELGFDQHLQFYSFQYGQAKPGTFLYEKAQLRLDERGIRAENVVYVGNDMLNDVFPAAQVGFRTALFAGDKRSLRWREDDSRVGQLRPDVILTDLAQLASCLPT